MTAEFRALATDYDGTLASEGHVAHTTLEALSRLRGKGINLILVTGRRCEELAAVFPGFVIFHMIVAENGAVLHVPGAEVGEELLAPAPPEDVIARLHRELPILETGRVVIATRRPWDRVARRIIRRSGLSLAVTYNREAAMFLPTGVDKETGVAAALERLGLDWKETMGIGDAENDMVFLARCGYSVAVGNALPQVKTMVDSVSRHEDGRAVVEAISAIFGL